MQKSLNSNYEDDLTKGWILNSLSKLASCPKFPSAPTIAEITLNYSRSKVCDLYQRALEYNKLTKFKWALKQSSQLVVDPSLTFLSNFVQKAKEKGAKAYEPKKTITGWLSSLNLDNKDTQASGILYQAYEKQQEKSGGRNEEDNQNAIKVKGPKKWTDKGYEEDQPVSKPIPMQTGDKITQSISSSAFENKSKPKTTSGTTNTGFKIGGITSISSENYTGASSYKPDTKTPEKTANPFARPAAVDPNLNEKQLLASNIFKGIDTGNKPTGTGLFAVMNVKTSSAFGQAMSSKPMSKPMTKPSTTIDLLDIEDDNKPQEINRNEPNLLMGFNKPEEQINVPIKKENLFANLTSKKPNATPFNKLTQKFQVDQFEKYWESMPEELIEKFQSNIRSENEFKAMTETLGIDIIEIIDNEIICAGLNEKREVILIYGIYESSGNMEVRIKAKTPEEMRNILKVIKLYAS